MVTNIFGLKKPQELIGLLLVVFYLLLFPFGQLLRIPFLGVDVLLVDLIILTSVIFLKNHYAKYFKLFGVFIFSLIFSNLINLQSFTFLDQLKTNMYLLRLISYFSLAMLVYKLSKVKEVKQLIQNTLGMSLVLVLVVGWVQYLFFPDLRDFQYLGWDDHLYRLTGGFLDPNYMGIILLLGSLYFYYRAKFKQASWKYMLLIAMFAAILFTYSRATYLSLLCVITFSALIKKVKILKLFLLSILFGISVLLLPRPSSEGVKLERIHSVVSRVDNYSFGLGLIRSNPLFGVGFNNICHVQINYSSFTSRSVCGLDSSLLFLLATSGVLGAILFVVILLKIYKNIEDGSKVMILKMVLAIFMHSLFNNSAFYPFVMGLMAVVVGMNLKFKESS